MFFVLISLLLGATSPQESRVQWCHLMPAQTKEIYLPKRKMPITSEWICRIYSHYFEKKNDIHQIYGMEEVCVSKYLFF